jgi:Tol biopolymer transport system component
MNRTIILTFLAAIVTTNTACKKDDVITPPSWDLTGKIVFSPGGGGEPLVLGVFVLDMNSPTPPLRKLTDNGGEPRVSSNGHEIVYDAISPQGSSDIFVVDISGGPAINLTNDMIGSDSWPDWSPDGSSIVFNRGYYPSLKEALCVMNRDGSNLHTLTDTASIPTALMPRWSPDGSAIAFVQRVAPYPNYSYALYTIAPDGTHQVLLDEIGPTLPDLLPSWSPDSRSLAYGKTNTDGTGGLYVIDLSHRQTQKIDFSNARITPWGCSWLSSNSLVCVGSHPADSSYGIYLVTISPSLDEKLLATGLRVIPALTVSPDGNNVAMFGRANDDLGLVLYVVQSDGTHFRSIRVIDPSGSFFVDWSCTTWVK